MDELKYHIERKNYMMIKILTWQIPSEEFNKEILKLALNSESSSIVKMIGGKTSKKYFDKEIFEQAISTKNGDIFNVIATKSDHSFFDKNALRDAINTKNADIIKTFGMYSNKLLFDREILSRAIETKIPDVVRATVDNVVEKGVLSDYKNSIQKAILGASDITNLTAQILSRKDNESMDREMQEVILDIYIDVITKHFKKGDIPKDFPMKEFEKSIDQSRYYFKYPEGINFETLREKNRFLILPVFTQGHAFSAVVRMQEDKNISVTFVNLGARPFEMSGKGNQYKEFVYKPNDALKVLKDHCYNVRLYYPQKSVSTDEAYKNFSKNALEAYTVNVTSRDQKVGNCFLKNIEKGVRYALALGLSKSENMDFQPESLRVTSSSGNKHKVKFLKPVHLPGEKTNNLSTLALREELIKSLIEKFPEFRDDINKEWDIYRARKIKTYGKEPEFHRNWIGVVNPSLIFWAKPNDKKDLSENRNDEFVNKMSKFAERDKSQRSEEKCKNLS